MDKEQGFYVSNYGRFSKYVDAKYEYTVISDLH